ncbi:hypothetical protein BZA77DRAFT_254968, partial [Pyronema omphalodes]
MTSLLTVFQGNRGTCYCPYCYIQGVFHRGVYCPLEPPTDPAPPTVRARYGGEPRDLTTYDALDLPMRNDTQSRRIGLHVVQTGDENAAKKYGIKGPCCLSQLKSIDIPRSFPPDAMHLWWENIIPDLVKHWRGKFFSDLATANINPEAAADEYNIPPSIWLDISRDMVASANTFPTLFGDPIRNFAEHCHHLKAAEWRTFALHLAPIYLKDNLPDEDYEHYLNLIDAIQLACDNEITVLEVQAVRRRIARFIRYYE